MEKDKKYLLGIFEDEDKLMEAVHYVRQNEYEMFDVRTPFPVHGLDDVMGMKRSRIPVAGFLCGITGTAVAFGGMTWINTVSWSINVGGKPFFSVPTFIPITFELTVLFAAFGMVGVFLYANGLFPGKEPLILDERTTDDKFLIAFDLNNEHIISKQKEITDLLTKYGATEINEKVIED